MIMRFPGGLKKALTLSYDDGVEQDVRLIDIMNQHGLKGTFNINSGLFAPEGHVYPKGQVHRRMSLSMARELYLHSGHEVAVHGLVHAQLPELPVPMMVHEVKKDRENLEKEFGGLIRGMAYAFGSYNDQVVNVLENCGIAYCRTVQSTHQFSIPQDWLRLHPTCHHKDEQLTTLCDRFLEDSAASVSKLFYLWGHAYEFEGADNWHVIEEFAKKMGGRKDIWYATNIEIVDYVNAYRQLIPSADGHTIFNPTVLKIWAEAGGKIVEIASGETVHI